MTQRITDDIKVLIYHEMASPFTGFRPESATLELAYSYETVVPTGLYPLEAVWRDNNAVTGDEQNVIHHKRSLSVGDVVALVRTDGTSYHAVEAIGWKELSHDEVHAALERGKTFDPFEGL